MISTPTHAIASPMAVARLGLLCDAVVKLDSFQASPFEHDPALQDYHGTMNVMELSEQQPSLCLCSCGRCCSRNVLV